MRNEILEILEKINLATEYLKLCKKYDNLDNHASFTRQDVEPIIKSYDSSFKYVSKDRTFMKEFLYEEFTIRFFLGFKYGMAGFGYLVWKEGGNDVFWKGNLRTLTELIDSGFTNKVKNNSPIASTKDDYDKILNEIFKLYDAFKLEFEKIQF